MDTRLKEFESKMNISLEILDEDLNTIRAGRANPRILDKVMVDYYGQETPITQMATVSVPEARLIQIQPWDVSTLSSIERALSTSDIGIHPNNDGKVIRLSFPELTEEKRKELSKDAKKIGESSKIAIRNIRRDANTLFKKMEKDSEITEDHLKRLEDEVQEMTDKFIDKIDKAIENKIDEIMTV